MPYPSFRVDARSELEVDFILIGKTNQRFTQICSKTQQLFDME